MTNEVFFHNLSQSEGLRELVQRQIACVLKRNLRYHDQVEWRAHLSTERTSDRQIPEFIVEVLIRAPRLPTIIIKKSASSFDRALAAACAACAHALQKAKGRRRSYVQRTRGRDRAVGSIPPPINAHLIARDAIPSFG